MKRIYVVTSPNGTGITERLIEAGSQAEAIRLVMRGSFAAKAASSQDVARMMAAGQTVEKPAQKEAPTA